MSTARCAVLITGFGPFPGVPRNVSAQLAEQVGDDIRRRFPSSEVATAALPTEWDIAPERIVDLICELRPALALHFGVSDIAHGFVIETIARNAAARLDASGTLPMLPVIEPFGPDEMPTLLPAGRIQARLQRLGLPARLSRDAGTYLCNAVFYRSVLAQRELGMGGRSGFVHLPVGITSEPGRDAGRDAGRDTGLAGQRAARLTFERARQGGVEIVAACLNQ